MKKTILRLGVVMLMVQLAPWSALASQCPYGVLIGGSGVDPRIVNVLEDLGVGWVRINDRMDGLNPDFKRYLDAHINLVITFSNHDPADAQTTFGTPQKWPNAGFPYRSKEAYEKRIREALVPLLPYLSAGRQVWAQCENETGDVRMNPKSRYWRGTVDQYLVQIETFYGAVKAVDPRIPVVLTSFASGALDAVIRDDDPRHEIAVKGLTRLLEQGRYDAADLHFYGCVTDIAAKIEWVRKHMPAGKQWISTENGGPDSRCAATPLLWQQDPARFERLQAQQLPLRLTACTDAGAAISLVFSLFDLTGETDVFSHLGLLDPSVMPPRKKVAYASLKAFIAANR